MRLGTGQESYQTLIPGADILRVPSPADFDVTQEKWPGKQEVGGGRKELRFPRNKLLVLQAATSPRGLGSPSPAGPLPLEALATGMLSVLFVPRIQGDSRGKIKIGHRAREKSDRPVTARLQVQPSRVDRIAVQLKRFPHACGHKAQKLLKPWFL